MSVETRLNRLSRGVCLKASDTMHSLLTAALLCILVPSVFAAPVEVPTEITAALDRGLSPAVLVLLDTVQIEAEAMLLRDANSTIDNAASLSYKVTNFRKSKAALRKRLPAGDQDVLTDYSHLPMLLLKLKSRNALNALITSKSVIGIYEDRRYKTALTQSRPLIGQPSVVAAGYTGANQTVVVLDTGVNYTLADFGTCSAPNVPASCRVVVAQDLAPNDGVLDDNGHGTNVSGIVAGVATGAKLAVFDVFDGLSASSSTILAGMNWAIANKAAYNIVAINLSIGDGLKYTSLCSNSHVNPFVAPIASAFSAGILTVIASGNEAFPDGINNPACTPLAISVGAVYDANVGAISYTGLCSETSTAADNVTCFSNSAGFLTMLAPGALITAAGFTQAGTSQATPHVAAAVAILREHYPGDTPDMTLGRLTDSGTPVLDTRNGLTFPRLNLLESNRPDNDRFSNALSLGTDPGQTFSTNVLASKETGEPDHAGSAGGASVWFAWTAPASGSFTFTTQGSSFDTLLAVYQGGSVQSLTTVASNNDDGTAGGASSVTVSATAGQTYWVAVDGNGGSSGNITLAWAASTLDAEIPLLPPWAAAALVMLLSAAGVRGRYEVS